MKAIFHDDSIVVSGVFNGNGQQFATEICRTVQNVFDQTFHSIANQWIEVDGDGAVGETYVVAISSIADAGKVRRRCFPAADISTASSAAMACGR